MITESVIGASGIIFGALLLVFALTGMVDKLAKLFTNPSCAHPALARLVFLKKRHRADCLSTGVSQRSPWQIRRIPHQSHHRGRRFRPGVRAP